MRSKISWQSIAAPGNSLHRPGHSLGRLQAWQSIDASVMAVQCSNQERCTVTIGTVKMNQGTDNAAAYDTVTKTRRNLMLHPQAKALLELIERAQVSPIHTLTPATARMTYRERRFFTQ